MKTYTWSCQCIICYNGTQTILTQQVDFWFYSKDEATIFYANIQNFNDFKAKLLGNRVAQIDPNQTDEILENFAVAVSIKYLNNFWISLEMTLINCNVKLELTWTKDSVLSTLGSESNNADTDSNNIIILNKKIYVPVITSSAKDYQNYKNILSKGFERSVYWNEYKTKNKNKNTTNNCRRFLESNFVEVIRLFVFIYPNQNNSAKRFNFKKYYKRKGHYLRIKTSSLQERTFMTNPCVKNHYRLIAVDLTRQKELYVDPKASWQIEFLWQLSKLNPNGITTDIAADQNMFVLTIF